MQHSQGSPVLKSCHGGCFLVKDAQATSRRVISPSHWRHPEGLGVSSRDIFQEEGHIFLHKGSMHLSSLFLTVVKRKEEGGGRRRRQKRRKWRKQNPLREQKVGENYYKDRKKEIKDGEFLPVSELRRSLASSSPKFSLKGQTVTITSLFWGLGGL